MGKKEGKDKKCGKLGDIYELWGNDEC